MSARTTFASEHITNFLEPKYGEMMRGMMMMMIMMMMMVMVMMVMMTW